MNRPTPLRRAAVVLVASALACGDSPSDVVSEPGGATYRVTFEATWSAATHPTDFPPGPHFSGLIGATHDSRIALWSAGGLASPGMKNMAETGGKSPLSTEVEAAIDAGTAAVLLSGDGIGTSPGTASLEFAIGRDHPLVSLVSMIAPSPDWFVGVHDLSLLEGDEWRAEVVVELLAYDAGTDSGTSYTSANQPTQPQAPIQRITSSPFDAPTPLGRFVFVRISG